MSLFRKAWFRWLLMGIMLLIGALYKNAILGAVRKIPVVGTLEDKIGENATK
tara:strand:+ start:26901 stop:27056 length:156 start_codon:yes stop_codon:yes gene_type:complete